MEQSLNQMRTALRVLTALTQQLSPDAADIETLRLLTTRMPMDSAEELACQAIRQALKRREHIRMRAARMYHSAGSAAAK
jgi:hypothetical protein